MADTSKRVRRPQTSVKRNYSKGNVSNDHLLRKRTPHKQVIAENSIFVTKSTNIKAYITKCEKLFNKNYNEIIINCMGAAIQQGINLALQLCQQYPLYQISTSTSTIYIIDDLEPLIDEADYETQRRTNSAVQIKIMRRKIVEV